MSAGGQGGSRGPAGDESARGGELPAGEVAPREPTLWPSGESPPPLASSAGLTGGTHWPSGAPGLRGEAAASLPSELAEPADPAAGEPREGLGSRASGGLWNQEPAPAPNFNADQTEWNKPAERGFNSDQTVWGGAEAASASGVADSSPAEGSGTTSGPSLRDPREELTERYRLLSRRFPGFAPHAEVVFERIEELGRGGMGVVYRVRDSRLGRQAALKLLRPEARGVLMKRFRRESEVTARLDHPGIPPVYEAGSTASGEQYLLIRLIEGKELRDGIEGYHAAGRPPERLRELLEVLLRLAEAVAYANGQGVVHRDLKPDNVMVGRFGEVLVMDWGLARVLAEEQDETVQFLELEVATGEGLTLSGSVLGTPGYMPPEQARGDEVDVRADVFALGAILSTILTGRPPFRGENSKALLEATRRGEVELPASRLRGISPELNALAQAALAPDRAERIQSAQHFVNELRAYFAGERLRSYTYSLRERVVRRARRRPGLLLGVSGLLLAAGVLALVGFWAWEAETARELAEGRERESKFNAELAQIRQHQAEGLKEEVLRDRARVNESLRLLAEAKALASEGDAVATQARVEGALAGGGSSFLYWVGSEAYERCGRLDLAIEVLERSVRESPPGYRALYRIHALTQSAQGLPPDAETPALDRLLVLAAARGDENAYTALVQAGRSVQAGDLEQALRASARAVELGPGLAVARLERARILRLAGQSEGALAELERAVKLTPTWAAPLLERSELRLASGLLEESLGDASLAVELTPQDVRGQLARARALRALGRWVELLRAIETAEGLAPPTAEGRLLRAEAQLERQAWTAAAASLEAARALGANEAQRRALEERLAKARGK